MRPAAARGPPLPPLLKLCIAAENSLPRARSEIDAHKILVIFRKLGVKFTVEDRDALFKQMDTAHRGAASFTEFAVSFTRVDCSKIGGLSDCFKCVRAPRRVRPRHFTDAACVHGTASSRSRLYRRTS